MIIKETLLCNKSLGPLTEFKCFRYQWVRTVLMLLATTRIQLQGGAVTDNATAFSSIFVVCRVCHRKL
jgi:hypothetical protein